MADTEAPQTTWAERGAYWAATSPEGKSDMDAGNQAIIAAAEIGEGDRVLDLASGAGEPSISIALKVGETGNVTATDANPEMLAGARKRAENLGLQNISFEITEMENLPFPDNEFDKVTCRFGIMFPDDAVAAVREVLRVLKPGGVVCYMVHGTAAENDLYSVLRETVLGFLGEDPSPAHNRRFRFSGEGELTKLLTEAGFTDVSEERLSERQQRPGGRFWQRLLDRSYGSKLGDLSEARMEELQAAIAEAFEPYKKGDGYEVLSTDRIGLGRKPA